MPTPRVFVSYSWDDESHRDWVLDLATRLREDGVDARLDRWHLKHDKTIPQFMDHEVRRADKVLVVCTPTYQQKVHATEDGENITGVGWETMLISTSMFYGAMMGKVVPILARGTWNEAAPSFLQGFAYFDLSHCDLAFDTGAGSPYAQLVRALRGEELEPPPIRSVRARASEAGHRAAHNLPLFPYGFVGRTEELSKLVDWLDVDQAASGAPQHRVAITGMPGIGKTQLALRYAWFRRDAFDTVCWIDADGADAAAAWAALYERPLALGPATTPLPEKLERVRERLGEGGPHLLVFDDLDRPQGFLRFIPSDARICVLATSVREDLERFKTVHLNPLCEAEAMTVLRGDRDWSADEEQAARELGEEFGRLPLGVGVAGTLLKRPSWWPSKLLARIRRQGGPVVWSSGLPREAASNVSHDLATLFETSLDLLDSKEPIDRLARRILFAAGWMAPAPIPPLLLRNMVAQSGATTPDWDQLEDALARLVEVNLATMHLHPAVTFHRLVAEFSRLRSGTEHRDAALRLLGSAAEDLAPNVFLWPVPGLGGMTLEQLRPHLEAALPMLEPGMSGTLGWIPMRLAELLEASQQAEQAAAMLKTAATQAPDHVWAARLQCMQARLLVNDGLYEEALPILKHAIPVLREALQTRHTETALAGVSLARAWAGTDRAEEATRLLESLSEEFADPENPAPAGSFVRHALARQLAQNGRGEDALIQLIYAMAIDTGLSPIGYLIEEAPGDLFVELFAERVVAGDEPAVRRVLDRACDVLGPELNAHIVRAHHSAGLALVERERAAEALPYLEAALRGAERLKPRIDTDVGATHFVLGQALAQVQDYGRAVAHLEKALAIAKKEFAQGDARLERTRAVLEALRANAG